jgi:hypothetical protein
MVMSLISSGPRGVYANRGGNGAYEADAAWSDICANNEVILG